MTGEEYEVNKLLTVTVSASGLFGGERENAPPTPEVLHQLSNSYKKLHSSCDIVLFSQKIKNHPTITLSIDKNLLIHQIKEEIKITTYPQCPTLQ